MKQKRRFFLLLLLLWVMGLNGCATFRSYHSETQTLVSNLSMGHVDQALAQHEAKTGADKDLLYFMEKGELQRLKKHYPEVIATWTEADQRIAQWESEAKVSSAKIGQAVGSVMVNDKLRRYEGEDYEKVMLSTRLALAYLAAGKPEDALVEIKKTWERENLIQSLHEKEIEGAENEAKQKGYLTKSEDLKGYPIATLNNPDVINLKNGYQNAFSHYLSGFLYEAAGEWSLATASYRTAIELQPALSILKESLLGLDERQKSSANAEVLSPATPQLPADNKPTDNKSKKSKKKGKKDEKNKSMHDATNVPSSIPAVEPTASSLRVQSKDSDVLFVIETGVAPLKKSVSVPLPIPYAGIVPISFPVLESVPLLTNSADSIRLPNNTNQRLTLITSIEHLSRRSLKDHLPSLMVRAAMRAALKGASQAAAYRQNLLAGLALNALNVVTEQADERTWGLLPAEIKIARVKLPEGLSTVKIETSQGLKEITVNISGKYVVVPIRLIGDFIYNLQTD
jgi:hypothetical protein